MSRTQVETYIEPTDGTPSGNVGMWWFLASEICVFGGLLVCFILMRIRHQVEWSESMSQTMTSIGFTNTVLLLTSSLFVVLSHHYASQENIEKATRYMGLTILGGLLFMCLKGFEYFHELSHGILPMQNLFWSFYYLVTGLHGLHVLIGIVANILVWMDIRKGKNLGRVEVAGLYWHFVDVIWIFVFPLFYVSK